MGEGVTRHPPVGFTLDRVYYRRPTGEGIFSNLLRHFFAGIRRHLLSQYTVSHLGTMNCVLAPPAAGASQIYSN